MRVAIAISRRRHLGINAAPLSPTSQRHTTGGQSGRQYSSQSGVKNGVPRLGQRPERERAGWTRMKPCTGAT